MSLIHRQIRKLGEAHGPARAIDLEPLYDRVNIRFAELDIEGAFISGDAPLLLLQRGSTVTIGMVTDADDPAIPAELEVTTL